MSLPLHFAIFDPSPSLTVLKEDVYTSLCWWLRAAGHPVSVDRAALRDNTFNLIVGFEYLSLEQRHEIATRGAPYGLFDVEILSDGMVNFKPETQSWFDSPADEFLRRSKFLLTYYTASASFMRHRYDLPVHILPPGHCPVLCTHEPVSEIERNIDVLFFGRVYDNRAKLLERLSRSVRVRTLDIADSTPLFLRNELAVRAKLVLHLGQRSPFKHIGMIRLLSMAHIGAFSLSEWRSDVEPTLEPLSAWWCPPAALADEVERWLRDASGRERVAGAATTRILETDVTNDLATFLDTYLP